MNEYNIFTDGFFDMNTNVGASAVVVLKKDADKPIFERARARKVTPEEGKKQYAPEQELGACIRAVMVVPEGSTVTINSDSQYAVNVLNKNWNAKTNLGLIDRFFSEVRERHIKYRMNWVRGHNGNVWNERADELCELAAQSLLAGGKGIIQNGLHPFD